MSLRRCGTPAGAPSLFHVSPRRASAPKPAAGGEEDKALSEARDAQLNSMSSQMSRLEQTLAEQAEANALATAAAAAAVPTVIINNASGDVMAAIKHLDAQAKSTGVKWDRQRLMCAKMIPHLAQAPPTFGGGATGPALFQVLQQMTRHAPNACPGMKGMLVRIGMLEMIYMPELRLSGNASTDGLTVRDSKPLTAASLGLRQQIVRTTAAAADTKRTGRESLVENGGMGIDE